MGALATIGVNNDLAACQTRVTKNMVAAGIADEMLVQVSYAIGVAKPMNIYVNTYGRSKVQMSDSEIAKKIEALFDLRPKAIERTLKLRQPIYSETAAYGHMGRQPETIKKTFTMLYAKPNVLRMSSTRSSFSQVKSSTSMIFVG